MLLHLVNLSGHSQTAYFDPVPMHDIEIAVAGKFSRAQTRRTARSTLKLRTEAGRTSFVLPSLSDYEVIVLE